MFYDVVICFVLFSFCGWVCESVFCSILERKVVNRGFLNGPLCPVYGFGGLIIAYILGPLQGNYIALFLMGMVACTVLEYITSWLLEKLFHAKWWDYSDNRFNINGRVCLSFSLIFGALSVAAAELLYPPIVRLLDFVPDTAKMWLSVGLIVVIGLDCWATVYSLIQFNGKLAEIKAAMEELRQKLEAIQGERIPLSQRIEAFLADHSDRYEPVRQSIQNSITRFEKLIRQNHFQQRRILKAFPNMRSTKYQDQLARLKEVIAKRGKKKREKKYKKQ